MFTLLSPWSNPHIAVGVFFLKEVLWLPWWKSHQNEVHIPFAWLLRPYTMRIPPNSPAFSPSPLPLFLYALAFLCLSHSTRSFLSPELRLCRSMFPKQSSPGFCHTCFLIPSWFSTQGLSCQSEKAFPASLSYLLFRICLICKNKHRYWVVLVRLRWHTECSTFVMPKTWPFWRSLCPQKQCVINTTFLHSL